MQGFLFRPGLRVTVRAVLLIAFAAFAARVEADVIVLKNGRRIIAYHVVEQGDKVTYQTRAGELTLPKSIVDHVERDNAATREAQAVSAASLDIAAPVVEAPRGGDSDVDALTVHDGFIDREYIAKLENAARGGAPRADQNAALAHHAASQFELSRGDLDHALSDERTALNFEPDDPALLANVAYMHLRRSEYKQALEYIERAKRRAPDDPEICKLAGWAYYGLSKLDQAVEEWRRSYVLRPDPETKAALEKAERDKQQEESYKENESTHFNLRYDGSAEPELARDVLRTLETHFSAIESELGYTPPDSITVILYTRQAFVDVTQAPGWSSALNDGRIRVPVQGLNGMSPELSRVLKHELTHSFVDQKTHQRAPTWIHEGLAQWMEGKRSGENAPELTRLFGQGRMVPLGSLEGSWMNFDSNRAAYAYAWALANIEYIVMTYGMGDVERILDRIGASESTESAVRAVLHSEYGDLMQSAAAYLKKAYGD
jgi:tetratricopeptide (TPR) repeat protein